MTTPWTPEEEKILLEAIPECSGWDEIAERLARRNTDACRKKYGRIRKGTAKFGSRDAGASPPAISAMDVPEFDGERLFDVIEELKEVVDRADPISTSEVISIDSDKPIVVMFTSCWHLGGRYVFYGKFRELLERTLETPRVYWGVHGDVGDFFMPTFRNAEPILSQLVHPAFQRRLAAYVLGKLAEKGRLLYGCAGNHEDFVVKAIGEDLMKPEYQERHIPYFVGKGAVRLQVGAEEYMIGVAHRWPGSSYFNPTHAEIRALMNDLPDADIIAGGHLHGFAHQEIAKNSLSHDAGTLRNVRFHAVAIGTASCGPDPYSIKGWSRGVFEWPMLCLYPDRHQIKRVYDWEDLDYFLKLKGAPCTSTPSPS